MMQAKIPEYLPEISSKITFSHINTQKNTFTFTVQNGQKDWVILKVYKKPFINFLWLGACVACLGMSISIYRRFKV
jgi:cytochrome c biogenesis factor